MVVYNSIVRRFFAIFFSSTIVLLLIFNMQTYASDRFNDTYFGFNSFFSMLNDFGTMPSLEDKSYYIGSFEFTLYLPRLCKLLFDYSIGLVQQLLQFGGNYKTVLEILRAAFNLFVFPIRFTAYAILLFGSLVWDIGVIIQTLFNALEGRYNVPVPIV